MTDFTDFLIPNPLPQGTEFWRATVIDTDPLRVERVQGIMPATPENYAGIALGVGDRVFGLTLNTRPVIVGVNASARQPYAMAAGTAIVSDMTGTPRTGEVTVTFPEGRFTEPPIITATSTTNQGRGDTVVGIRNANTSTATFGVTIHQGSGQSRTIRWVAVQMEGPSK